MTGSRATYCILLAFPLNFEHERGRIEKGTDDFVLGRPE